MRKDERAAAWFHPVRIKLADLLRKRGPMTQTELARAIDAEPASARYHLLRLVRAGFVAEAGTRPGPKAITERLFRYVKPEQPVSMATAHGSAEDLRMRKLNLASVAEIHRVGARIIEREPQRFFGIRTVDLRATPERLRALRDALEHTLNGFLAAQGESGEGEPVTLCLNFYPRHPDAEEGDRNGRTDAEHKEGKRQGHGDAPHPA